METVVFKSPFGESEDTAPARSPELHDTKYSTEVLGLPSGISEDSLDRELLAKAHSLGIAASALEKQGASSSVSSSIWSNLGDRSVCSSPSSANITPHSSICGPPSPLLVSEDKSKEPKFAPYERYLSIVDSQLRPKFRQGSLPALRSSSQSVFSVSTKKSFSSVNNAKSRKWWQKKPIHGMDRSTSCLGCRANISRSLVLHGLDCNHAYCTECLRFLVAQAMVAEANMPPRCCAQAIPSSTLESALDRATTTKFLNLVTQYSTPPKSRIYCPSEACGKFIPHPQTIDPKHPFDATCSSCRTRVCIGCKQDAHPINTHCDDDWELEALVKIGQKPAWQRCYQCQELASLTTGEDYIVCRCGAEMCHDCGAVWDATTGCPNLCSDEDEIARRRQSEERASHEVTAAIHRSLKPGHTTEEIRSLGRHQNEELARYCSFLQQSQSGMRVRHSTEKLAVLEKHTSQQEELKEQHAKDVGSLEDRQVAAEIELRNTLEQTERSVRLRLKHMEAYCKGQNAAPTDAMPSRVITEKDLDQLDQQYTLLQGMEQQHQTKINVMRERQTKRMEELLAKQKDERANLNKQHSDEIAEQDMRFAADVHAIEELFRLRQIRMNSRWALQMEVLSKDQTQRAGVACTPLPTPVWPKIDESDKMGVAY